MVHLTANGRGCLLNALQVERVLYNVESIVHDHAQFLRGLQHKLNRHSEVQFLKLIIKKVHREKKNYGH